MTLDTEVKHSRPQLQHMKTTPDLVGGRYNPGIPTHTNEERKRRFSLSVESNSGPDALLAEVQNRSNEDYRDISFPPHKLDKTYQLRISFDTIDIRYYEDNDPMAEFYDDDSLSLRMRRMSEDHDNSRGRRRESDLKIPGISPVRSPSASPTRMMSPHRNMASMFRGMLKYPTTPIITHRGTAFTRIHYLFEDLYLGKLAHKGLGPVLPRRVILVYISGRKHTWVALDWILRNFIEHGDSIIIASAINHKLASPSDGQTRYPSPNAYAPKTPRVRLRQRRRPEFVKEITRSVMHYVLNVINKDVIAKVAVEIIDSNTKDALKDMYKLYEPNIVCVGSKVNTKNSAPLKSWQSSRLSDRLVKNFPLPVIVVPALNMSEFEKKVQLQLVEEATGKTKNLNQSDDTQPAGKTEKMNIIKPKKKDDDDDDLESLLSSDDSDSVASFSGNSVASSASYSSFKEVADVYKEYRLSLHDKLDELKFHNIDESYFVNFAKAISDKSLQLCDELRGIDPDFKGKGAKLASAITGSNSFGKVPYKTKSLLEPDPIPSNNGPSTGKSYSELKKTLTRNAQNNEARNSPAPPTSSSPPQQIQFANHKNVPSITIDDSSKPSKSPTPAPNSSSLKFSDLGTPHRLKERSNGLKKFFSNDERSVHQSLIKPTKSNPEVRSNDSEDKKKKKKKKFWIF